MAYPRSSTVILLACIVLGLSLWFLAEQATVPVPGVQPTLSAPPFPPSPKVVVTEATIPPPTFDDPPSPETANQEIAEISKSDPEIQAGSLHILTIEEGTREPVPQTLLVIRHTPDPDARPREVLLETLTDQFGIASFDELPPGKVQVRFGSTSMRRSLEETTVEIPIVAGETAYHTEELPARIDYLYRLIDPEEQPVANFILHAGYSTAGTRDNYVQHIEPTRTRADGTFILRAPPQIYYHIVTADGALFLPSNPRPNERWSNPGRWSMIYGQVPGVPRDIMIRSDQVTVIAHLRNRPPFADTWTHTASIVSGDVWHNRDIGSDSTFTFDAPPGAAISITIQRHRDMYTPEQMLFAFDMQRIGASSFGLPIETITDHLVTITLPEEPGTHEVDIFYEDRHTIPVRVMMPGFQPAVGVIVSLFPAATREEATAILPRGWPPGPSTRYGVVATDNDGVAQLEIPQTPFAVFNLEARSLPEEARTYTPVVHEWSDFADGITLHLDHSHMIWGEVVDSAGRPIHGAYVKLEGPALWRAARDTQTRTNEEGIFELNIPRDGDGPPPADLAVHLQATVMHRVANEPWDMLGVAKCAIDSPKPIRIVAYPATTFSLEVTSGGARLPEYDYAIRYNIPEFIDVFSEPRPIRIETQHGHHGTGRLPIGGATLLVKHPGAPDETAVELLIPETITSTYNPLSIELPPLRDTKSQRGTKL